MDKHMSASPPVVQVVSSQADPGLLFLLDSGSRLHLLCPLTLVLTFTWQQRGVQVLPWQH